MRLRPELEWLEEEARGKGEAYMALKATPDLTIGIAATASAGRPRFAVEVQVRLLPPDSAVDLDELGKIVASLRRLRSMRFALHHYDGGWVTASMALPQDELAINLKEIEAAVEDVFKGESA